MNTVEENTLFYAKLYIPSNIAAQVADFSANIVNEATLTSTPITSSFVVLATSVYGVQLSLPVGDYLIQISNPNAFNDVVNIPIQSVANTTVQAVVNATDIHSSLDSYPNKDNWKGLTTVQDAKLTSMNVAIGNNTTTIGNIKATVDTLPLLLDIENSTQLAMKNDITVVEQICNSLPVLMDIRNELINVTFGGLEIANNQLTIKDKNGSVIAIFDLFDKNGQPTMLSVFKRTVVV